MQCRSEHPRSSQTNASVLSFELEQTTRNEQTETSELTTEISKSATWIDTGITRDMTHVRVG